MPSLSAVLWCPGRKWPLMLESWIDLSQTSFRFFFPQAFLFKCPPVTNSTGGRLLHFWFFLGLSASFIFSDDFLCQVSSRAVGGLAVVCFSHLRANHGLFSVALTPIPSSVALDNVPLAKILSPCWYAILPFIFRAGRVFVHSPLRQGIFFTCPPHSGASPGISFFSSRVAPNAWLETYFFFLAGKMAIWFFHQQRTLFSIFS